MFRRRIVSLVTRRYPFLSGCGNFANSALVQRLAGPCVDVEWTRLDCGHEILAPLDDFVGRAAYFVGDLDRKLSALVKTLVRPGDCVLDIGANIGVMSLLLAKCVGPTGSVHAFEPNPLIRRLLAQSVARNSLRNIEIHDFALGNEEGQTLTLAVPAGNSGAATLKKGRSHQSWQTVPVQIRTLSNFARDSGLGPVRLVKIDVEGFESEVLAGGASWLTSCPPDFIVYETNEAAQDRLVCNMLTEFDYALFTIPKRLISLSVEPADPDSGKGSHDMLAVRKGLQPELARLLYKSD